MVQRVLKAQVVKRRVQKSKSRVSTKVWVMCINNDIKKYTESIYRAESVRLCWVRHSEAVYNPESDYKHTYGVFITHNRIRNSEAVYNP